MTLQGKQYWRLNCFVRYKWGFFQYSSSLGFFKWCWNLFSLFCSRLVGVLNFQSVCSRRQASLEVTPQSVCRLTCQVWQSTGVTSGLPRCLPEGARDRGNASAVGLCLLGGTRIAISKIGCAPRFLLRVFAHNVHPDQNRILVP